MNLEVLYEDNHIIGVVKPAGVLSQSDGREPAGEDMLSVIGEYLRVKYNKPGKAFVGLVHRLDRNVGGTMLFAKTSKGASRLSAEMRSGSFKKGYFALAEGYIDTKNGILRHFLYKDEQRNIVTNNPKKGKESILAYETVGRIGKYTLVFALPITGRTHQIRVHMNYIGFPICNDPVYGKGKKTTNLDHVVETDDNINTVLGCWVINHIFNGVNNGGKVLVNGTYDINIWYSYDNNTKTNVLVKRFNYNDVMNVKIKENGELTNTSEIIVRALNQPSVTDVSVDGNKINLTVHKEMGVEVVGDTKVRVSVEDEFEDYEEIIDEEFDTDNIEVSDDYLK